MKLPRFYPLLDPARELPLEMQARVLADCGVLFAQIRHKENWSQELLNEARRVRQSLPDLIINDRADVAAMLHTGVHVGQTDLPPRDVRKLLPEATVGFSTHNERQVENSLAQPIDYVAFGPIFPTASKKNPDPVVGLEGLRRARALTKMPLVAIGGVNRGNAFSVLEAGADSVAVIGDLYPVETSASAFRARVEEWQRLLN